MVDTKIEQEPDAGPLIVQPVKGYFSVAEAATYLGIAETNVRNYIRDGYLPAAQFVPNGRIIIKRADLDAFVAANHVQGGE